MADSFGGNPNQFFRDEYYIETPEIFSGLPIAYGETRIDDCRKDFRKLMSGNTTYRPNIIEQARQQYAKRRGKANWLNERQAEARGRIGHLRRLLGFNAILLTMPVHGTSSIVEGSSSLPRLDAERTDIDRIKADAIFTRENRIGTMFNPADCVIANTAFYENGDVSATGQIHTGTNGLINNIIGKSLGRLRGQDLDPADALVYLSPLMHNYTIYGEPYEMAVARGLKSYLSRDGERYRFDMKSLAIDQLIDSGVNPDNIRTSPIDTFESSEFYSNRQQTEHQDGKVPIGRNGIVFGKVDRS